jgi:hypothetical protein
VPLRNTQNLNYSNGKTGQGYFAAINASGQEIYKQIFSLINIKKVETEAR